MDYAKGVIVRYFVRKLNDKMSSAVEVDASQYKMFKDNSFYGTTSCIWMISGNLTDSTDEYGVFESAGVRDSNRREATLADKKLNGVWENLHDYTQFYKPS